MAKVKTHQNMEGSEPKSAEWRDARGNEEADAAAKQAIVGHPALHLGHVESEVAMVRKVLTLIGKSLAL